MALTQDNDIFKIHTPLGPGVIFLETLQGKEELGRPFEYELGVASEDESIKFEDLLGQCVALEVVRPDGTSRFFHGHVAEMSQVQSARRVACYKMSLRPWVWLLSKTKNCRTFQEMTAPDIIKMIFRDHGFSDFKDSLEEDHPEHVYTVQYRESDLDFVSRLMEGEGIYYYHEHEKDKHTLVLCDSMGAHKRVKGYEKLPFIVSPDGSQKRKGCITSWQNAGSLQTGKLVLRSYDFEQPKADLEVKSKSEKKHKHAGFEVYDYPGTYTTTGDGEGLAKAWVEEQRSHSHRVKAKSPVRAIGIGDLFELTDHFRKDQNVEHLITAAKFELTNRSAESKEGDGNPDMSLDLEATTTEERYVVPRVTPKPTIRGPQTAVVVGKDGEEIWTDLYGRVKVQFHWDRVGKYDEDSSCWIRVSQTWAGKTWGGIAIPRIGQEVIVEFMEGDPDRPLITGRVYNGDEMPPYKLPDNQTQSGVKSRSTKEGSADNFNELRFEDKKDEEEIYFHAEKDFNRVVENNDTLKVGFDKKEDGDQTIEVHNNRKVVVGNKESKDGSLEVEVWKNRKVTVKEGDETIKIEKGKQDITVAMGSGALTFSQGDYAIDVKLGKVELKAMKSIELKVGESSIKMEPTKITLKSTQIEIKGTASVLAKAAKTDVSGSGALTLKGGIVNIN